MSRRQEGLADERVTDLLAFFRAYPAVGLIAAAMSALVAAYFQWVNPKAIMGSAVLWAICFWMGARIDCFPRLPSKT